MIMKNESLVETKRAELRALMREVAVLDEKRLREEEYPRAKKLQGTFWKYRNCYSAPNKESDYWWMFQHVVEVKPDGLMLIHEFQIDSNGEAHFQCGKRDSWRFRRLSGWQRATRREWTQALRVVQAKLDTIKVRK